MNERAAQVRIVHGPPHGRRCVAFVMAMAANVLLFYSLAAVRSEPSVEAPHRMELIPLLAIDLPDLELPVPEEPSRLEPELPSPAAQKAPAPAILPTLEPLLPFTPRFPEGTREVVADLPGLPIVLPGSADLRAIPSTPASPVGGPSSSSGVEYVPVKIAGEEPRYPPWARRSRLEGTVTLRFVVAKDGKVENVSICDIEGDERFGPEAVRAIARWFFEPATKDGKPVACWCSQKVHFKLVH